MPTSRAVSIALTVAFLGVAGACAARRPDPAASPRPAGEYTLTVDTLALWYRVAGRPQPGTAPLVFLHGGPGQGSEHYERFAGRHIEPLLQIVYFDQRASGRSGRGAPDLYTLDKLVDDIDSLRAALGVERISLVGHSFGGMLALEYAARHPERVASLVFAAGLWDAPLQVGLRCDHTNTAFRAVAVRVLGDSAADAARAARDCSWMRRLPAPERDSLQTATMFRDPRVAERLDSLEKATGRANPRHLGRALGPMLGTYRFTRFDRVTMPVLVIAGRHDGGATPEGLRQLAAQLPDARFVEYEASGHFVYLDEPERFARDVAAFVRGRR